jgi:hypothetical protein
VYVSCGGSEDRSLLMALAFCSHFQHRKGNLWQTWRPDAFSIVSRWLSLAVAQSFIILEYLISATASGSANSIVALGGTRISVAKISRYSPVPGFYDGTISRTSDLLLLKGGADVTGEEDLGT